MMMEEDTHQQFCLNDTKFIFYIDNPVLKKTSRSQTILSNRKKIPQNRIPIIKKNPSTKNNTQTGTSFNHSRRSAMQSISNPMAGRNLQSQRECRQKKLSPKNVLTPNINKINTQPCSPLAIRPLNLKKLDNEHNEKAHPLLKQNNKLNPKQEQNKQDDKSEQLLSVYDILKLFGGHHMLYKQGEDFITFDTTKTPKQTDDKNIDIPMSTTLRTNKKQLQVKQFAMSASRVSGQYIDTFHHERAPILTYLRNISPLQKKLYFLYTKEQGQQIKDAIQCHISIKQQCQWVKILPYVSMNLYPELQNKVIPQGKCPCQRPILFIQFLKTLYALQPDIITRLIQPTVSNIYSVWLFNGQESNFAPVFIDPYFIMHYGTKNKINRAQHSSEHCSTLGYPYLWLPILIKSILKTVNKPMYGSKQMHEIQIGTVFHMLTGLTLQQLDLNSQQTLNLKKNKYIISDEGHMYVLNRINQQNKSKLHEPDQSQINTSEQLIGYNYSTGIKKSFYASHFEMGLWKIYKLPNCITWFNYSIQANQNCLTKYELQIQRNTDFILQHTDPDCIRVYLYQQIQHSEKKTKLILKMQGKFSPEPTLKQLQSLKFKIKAGNYKLFVEHGEKKIHMFFSKRTEETVKQPSLHTNQHINRAKISRMSIQSSHEIKLGDGEILQRNNSGITQDSNFYYQKHGP